MGVSKFFVCYSQAITSSVDLHSQKMGGRYGIVRAPWAK